MKKNKKLLLASIGAMSLLALSVGAVGTAAWYQVASSVSVNNSAAQGGGTMTIGASTADSVNNFTITPTAVATSTAVAYTLADGTTKVSIPDGNGSWTHKTASTSAAKAVAITLKATITYSGDLTDKALVKNLWETNCSSVTLTVSCSSVTNTEGTHSVSGVPAVGDIRGVEDADADNSGPLAITKATNAEPFTTWSSATSTGELTFGTVYVALTGRDNLIVSAEKSPTYTLQIAATHS